MPLTVSLKHSCIRFELFFCHIYRLDGALEEIGESEERQEKLADKVRALEEKLQQASKVSQEAEQAAKSEATKEADSRIEAAVQSAREETEAVKAQYLKQIETLQEEIEVSSMTPNEVIPTLIKIIKKISHLVVILYIPEIRKTGFLITMKELNAHWKVTCMIAVQFTWKLADRWERKCSIWISECYETYISSLDSKYNEWLNVAVIYVTAIKLLLEMNTEYILDNLKPCINEDSKHKSGV